MPLECFLATYFETETRLEKLHFLVAMSSQSSVFYVDFMDMDEYLSHKCPFDLGTRSENKDFYDQRGISTPFSISFEQVQNSSSFPKFLDFQGRALYDRVLFFHERRRI